MRLSSSCYKAIAVPPQKHDGESYYAHLLSSRQRRDSELQQCDRPSPFCSLIRHSQAPQADGMGFHLLVAIIQIGISEVADALRSLGARSRRISIASSQRPASAADLIKLLAELSYPLMRSSKFISKPMWVIGIRKRMGYRNTRMEQLETVSALIGEIYDAALHPTLWLGVIEKATRFVSGPAASLLTQDARGEHANCVQVGPHHKTLDFEIDFKFDPISMGYLFANTGKEVATPDRAPCSKFFESRLYLERALPHRLANFLATLLDESASSTVLFGVFPHEHDGIVDQEARARIGLLLPHIRRAVLIGRVIDRKSAEAATFADAFDSLKAGMFLVDASGRIVHANVAGRVMLHTADMLRAAGDRIIAIEIGAQQALYDWLIAAGRETAPGMKGFALPLTDGNGETYSAHVLPLGARRQRRGATGAAAAIFVHKSALNVQWPPEALAKRYLLTPAELCVLLAVVAVGSGQAVARKLGVTESTVNGHVKRIYSKTGASRQADLVKLVAAFSNPLLG
jgi:DNA-binding CsgD family transcriptional regulator/PAS domain-containing protein